MSAPLALAAAGVFAQKSGSASQAGPIGLAVILLLCIASYFLFKSMSKHLRKVRENFPDQPTPPRVRAPRVHPAALPEPRQVTPRSLGSPDAGEPGSTDHGVDPPPPEQRP